MISICTMFYPWHREHDRTEEVFDVLVKGLNDCDGAESLELCFADAGVEDVWGRGRTHDAAGFHRRLSKEFRGKLNYLSDSEAIHVDDRGIRRYWLSKNVVDAVSMATTGNILIFGIDCYAAKDLISRYSQTVEKGRAWVIMPFCIPAGAPLKIKYAVGYGWHTAKGIVGIRVEDYHRVGGWEASLHYLKNKADSDFYSRMKLHGLKLVHEKAEGFFHVNHPGSNFGNGRNWRYDEE